MRKHDRAQSRLSRPKRLWALHAAASLDQRARHLSARHALRSRLVGLGLISLAAVLIALACMPGLMASLLFAAFMGLAGLRLIACLTPPALAPFSTAPCTALPQVSVLIALHREAAIIDQLADNLSQIDYPSEKLEVIFALETDDTETLLALNARELPAHWRVLLVPDGAPRTKPRALNYALRFARGEIITVYDAEDRPHTEQLRAAALAFAQGGQDLACLQAPLNWYNREETWLTRQFALEYAAHFNVLLPFYNRLGLPLPLGGTSNHFRRDALIHAGGWDAFNVTEDADLGLRLFRLGYRAGLIAPATLEEAPLSLRPWLDQRTRWIKGYCQSVLVHTRAQRAPSPTRLKRGLILTLGTAITAAFLHLPLTLGALALSSRAMLTPASSTLIIALIALGSGASLTCAAVGMQRAGLRLRLIDLLTHPFYWPLQTIAAARAVHQLLTRPHYWNKTEHGLSRICGKAKQRDA